MTENFASLSLALGIFAVGFISIGPNIPAIIGTSMEQGAQTKRLHRARRRYGIGHLGATDRDRPQALVTAYAEAMIVLKVFGAAYLLWLAYKAFRSA